jgi:signal transduction histidine kinase/CheY-like chemotaxis protein
MTNAGTPPSRNIAPSARTQELFEQHRRSIFHRTDRWFAGLMAFQWLAGIVAALWISPNTWAGSVSRPHVHVWAAVLLGGAISALPIALALAWPGRPVTRYVIAVSQMLTSALLIHLTGGRIETHFHVFGSLAFLAFYRDWRVFVPATVVVAGDHFLRGVYWPESVYGAVTASGWRWFEHAGWVIFEDIFLVASCRGSVQEMWRIAERQAELEVASAALRRARDAAESASLAKTEFLATISHEIRTPMNGIFGMTELALDTPDEAERRDFLLRARACAQSLMTILSDVLQFSRIEARKDELERHEFDLRDVLDAVLDTLAFESDRRQLELIGSYDDRRSGRVVGDAGRLRQVLINLASNALKFTDSGEIEIRLETIPSGSELLLRATVRDTGIGIPHEKQAQIFDAFAQAHSGDPRSSGGIGLGLAISQRLVRMMGGELGVESQPGRGSTFWFTARLGEASHAAAPAAGEALAGKRVLIVDTHEARGRMLSETVRGVRADPVVEADPARAPEALAAAIRYGQPFSAVILSVDPEPLRATVDEIRAHPGLRDIPVVALVPLRGPDFLGRDPSRLAATFSKPIKLREFVAALSAATTAAPDGRRRRIEAALSGFDSRREAAVRAR